MIRIAIYGYGNIGRGVEAAVRRAADMELVGVFTRRDPSLVKPLRSDTPVFSTTGLGAYVNGIDVLVLCGGSATDLPVQSPALARDFNIVDSFDTHAKIREHFANVDKAARDGGKVGVISGGWDPGIFSLARLYFTAAMPEGANYTFWGRGVSQGHSDAIRRIEGVLDARQYTVPVPEALKAVREGKMPELSTRQKHTRECWVVAAEGADRERITREIVTMPNYFDEYDTTVNFITAEEMAEKHAGMPHGGTVIRSGSTGLDGEYSNTCELSLKLDSNPAFTGSILAACARAAYRVFKEGGVGCRTLFDLPPAYLFDGDPLGLL